MLFFSSSYLLDHAFSSPLVHIRVTGGQQVVLMGPNGVPQLSPAGNGNVQALMLQLRASEDGRMAALMEMQRLRTQLGYDQDLHLDSKMEVDQMTDELNQVRESKRKSEMQVMDMKEKVDLLNNELRTVKRTVTSLKRRLAQYSEDQKRQREQM